MKYRVLSLLVVAAAVMVLLNSPLQADDKEKDKNIHIGKLVSVKGNVFTMETKGKKHEHILGKDAKVFDVEGKECKLDDLKTNQLIQVTTSETDTKVATKVEAMKKPKGG